MAFTAPKRPSNLPSYKSPPVSEVVIGVQFAIPAGYHQIYAGDVWRLYKDQFPRIQEQVSLPPTFETFGLPSQSPNEQFQILSGAAHDRFWFLNELGDQLIQFQQDRLIHNWRKLPDIQNEYPRFEYMITSFYEELTKLEAFLKTLSDQKLIINQCEVAYINTIPVDKDGANLDDWLRFIKMSDIDFDVENFQFAFRKVILNHSEKPCGRLSIDATSAIDKKGQNSIRLSLTVRGAPSNSDIASAVDFLAKGRELIVHGFSDLTTEKAQKFWGREK